MNIRFATATMHDIEIYFLVIAGGAGGTVLVRTNHFDGMGTIEANGGAGATTSVSGTNGGGGGGGRIAVYHSGISTFIGSLETHGGESISERGGKFSLNGKRYVTLSHRY